MGDEPLRAPTPEELERASAAILPFVHAWNLPLDPENVDLIALAVLRYQVFVYIHVGWFALWILANVGAFGQGLVFDRFPFGLLTLVVSLEAIFLSTFILITQNRQGERSEARAQFDFHNNVRGEIWAAHIGQALGLDAHHVEHMVKKTVDGYLEEVKQSAHNGGGPPR